MRGSPSEQGLVAFHSTVPLRGSTAKTRPSSSSTASSPATAIVEGIWLPSGSSAVHSTRPASGPAIAAPTSSHCRPSRPVKATSRSSPNTAPGKLAIVSVHGRPSDHCEAGQGSGSSEERRVCPPGFPRRLGLLQRLACVLKEAAAALQTLHSSSASPKAALTGATKRPLSRRSAAIAVSERVIDSCSVDQGDRGTAPHPGPPTRPATSPCCGRTPG